MCSGRGARGFAAGLFGRGFLPSVARIVVVTIVNHIDCPDANLNFATPPFLQKSAQALENKEVDLRSCAKERGKSAQRHESKGVAFCAWKRGRVPDRFVFFPHRPPLAILYVFQIRGLRPREFVSVENKGAP